MRLTDGQTADGIIDKGTMTELTITPSFQPYPHQVHALRARASGARWIECIWHRRGGKDITAYNGLWASACKRVGNYVHVFPEAAQGRKVWWDDSAVNRVIAARKR